MRLAHVDVLGHRIAYRHSGDGEAVVLLHGNPTSSLMWEPVVEALGEGFRCIALDLLGMGSSDRLPGPDDPGYRFVHQRTLVSAALEALGLTGPVVLVGHDWGAVLAVDHARRHPDAVRGIAYMEAGVLPVSWLHGTGPDKELFSALRSSRGEQMVLRDNVFVEQVLQAGTLRRLPAQELDRHREPFLENGEGRRAMLTWARQIPIDGEPADVHELVAAGAEWMATSPVPKLLVVGSPGAVLTGALLEECRRWPAQREVAVAGSHFLPLDSPVEIGAALRTWLSGLDDAAPA